MSFLFTPAGVPVSSSHAVRTAYAVTASALTFPTTASIAEYVITYYGPTGPDGITVNATL